MFVNVPAPEPPLATPSVPEVIAEAEIAIAVEFAELIRPFASTLNAATEDAEPWSAAVIVMPVTSVLAVEKAELAYEPADVAFASAVLAETNAELAYEAADDALASAVFAVVNAELP